MLQLKDIGIRKWIDDFNGQMPNLHKDSYIDDQGAHVGDIAIDISTGKIWQCLRDNSDNYLWIELGQSSGGTPIDITPLYNIAYVDKNGNDNTAIIGNIAKPFKTINYAINVLNQLNNTDVAIVKLGTGIWSENIDLTKSVFFSGNVSVFNDIIITNNSNDNTDIFFINCYFSDVQFNGTGDAEISLINSDIFYNSQKNNLNQSKIKFKNSSLHLPSDQSQKVNFEKIQFNYLSELENFDQLETNNFYGCFYDLNKKTISNILDPQDDLDVVNKRFLIAQNISYNNTTSGLSAENVQDAIDELDQKNDDQEQDLNNKQNQINSLNTRVTQNENDIDILQQETTNLHNSSNINYDNTTSGLSAENVQDAIDELDQKNDDQDSQINQNSSNITNLDSKITQNENDIDTLQQEITNLHSASNIDYDNTTSGLSAENVQDAIDEVHNEVEDNQINETTLRPYVFLKHKSDESEIIVNLDSSMSATDIQNLINDQKRIIPYNKKLIFQFADGVYDLEHCLLFNDFQGAGRLYIQGNIGEYQGLYHTQSVTLNFNDETKNYGLYFHGVNVAEIHILNLAIHKSVTTVNSVVNTAIYAYSCGTIFYIQYNYTSLTSNHGYNIMIQDSNVADIKYNYVRAGNAGLYAFGSAEIRSGTNVHHQTYPEYGLVVYGGGNISKYPSQPQPGGSISNEYIGWGTGTIS